MMKRKYFFAACLILIFLAAGHSRQGVAEPSRLSCDEEAALFSLAQLEPLDLSPKQVIVEVYISPSPELQSFQRLLPQIWPRVQDFYARLGVLLTQVPGRVTPGPLDPRLRVRLEALPHKEWLARTYRAFKVEPPFRLRFLQVCQDKYAFAHLHLSTIHLDTHRFQKEVCEAHGERGATQSRIFAHLIIHELGHLFGLYHAHEFINDPIPEYLPDGKTPNFMSQHLTETKELGFTEWQRLLIHSFLGGGKVYQQYRLVDFDSLRYLELIKVHNRYLEPSKEKAFLPIRPQAFGDNEDEEDEEDDDFRFPGERVLTRCR
jgi:hypothetical protein